MSDFEEDVYDIYGEQEIGEGEDEPRGEDEGEETEFGDIDEEMGETAIAMEEAELVSGFEQQRNLRYRSETGEVVEGVSKQIQRSLKSPEETAIEQLHGFLSDSKFSDLSAARKETVVSLAEKLKNLSLLNVEVLAYAGLWVVEKWGDLEKKELQAFGRKYKVRPENMVDLIRYLRMMEGAKSYA